MMAKFLTKKMAMHDSLQNWEDGRVSRRRALNLVYSLWDRNAEITDYVFWLKSYKIKWDSWHYHTRMMQSSETTKIWQWPLGLRDDCGEMSFYMASPW